MKQQRVLIEGTPRSADGDWTQIGPLLAPKDRRGSSTVFVDAKATTVVFGWNDDTPGVWLDEDEPVKLGNSQRGHHTPIEKLPLLADLREGPFELDGPNARWRWSLID